ncbi:MAG TPA: prephenate dehydratase domain-containing protein [Terriglobia bacterium]|nr:prephenate dehydratase domain-containing protein [Terriglobia bacterium]
MDLNIENARVAFQGELGAFSEEAALKLLGETIVTVPRPTFDGAFAALASGAADALVVPIENSLAGSVLRVYDLLLESTFSIAAETVVAIEHHLIACPGASLEGIRSVESHPMALAQCERLLSGHPEWKRIPAEDTAGSARDVVASGDRTRAAIAGRRAAARYGGVILLNNVEDNAQNFTRFFLLLPTHGPGPGADKMTLAVRLAHRAGALLRALEPFARHGVNLLKIESRPIHGCPWEYQFFVDLAAGSAEAREAALGELRGVAQEVRVLGLYPAAPRVDAR